MGYRGWRGDRSAAVSSATAMKEDRQGNDNYDNYDSNVIRRRTGVLTTGGINFVVPVGRKGISPVNLLQIMHTLGRGQQGHGGSGEDIYVRERG